MRLILNIVHISPQLLAYDRVPIGNSVILEELVQNSRRRLGFCRYIVTVIVFQTLKEQHFSVVDDLVRCYDTWKMSI